MRKEGVHHRAKLNESQVRQIRKRHREGISQCRLAQEYRVSQGTVCQIVHGDTWKHLQDAPRDFTLKEWVAIAEELGGSNAEDRESILFVLAALHVGLDATAVSAAAGIEVTRCAEYARQIQQNGCVVDGKWLVDDDFDRNESVAQIQLVLWSLCAQGEVMRVSDRKEAEGKP